MDNVFGLPVHWLICSDMIWKNPGFDAEVHADESADSGRCNIGALKPFILLQPGLAEESLTEAAVRLPTEAV
jgi:hypothetical protein